MNFAETVVPVELGGKEYDLRYPAWRTAQQGTDGGHESVLGIRGILEYVAECVKGCRRRHLLLAQFIELLAYARPRL